MGGIIIKNKKVVILFLLIFLLISNSLVLAEENIEISFINPGHSDETFWVMVSEFMQAAADDLGVELEVLYSGRNRLNMILLAEEIANRSNKPDYVIAVNEDLAGDRVVELTDQAGIKTFIILNDFIDEQKEALGMPREVKTNWLGSLIPNNINAGYQIASNTIEVAQENKGDDLDVVAISGSRATPASVEREEGLDNALNEYDLDLLQMVYGDWNQDIAYQITKGLLSRYPNLDVIWAANDPMAIGALEAVEEAGLTAGEDVFIGGLNLSSEAIEYVKEQRLATTVGGHFMVGAWAVIILYDYHTGIDFAAENDLEMQFDEIFSAITSDNVDVYDEYLGDEQWDEIDFTEFSKALNPEREEYSFGLDAVLEQFE